MALAYASLPDPGGPVTKTVGGLAPPYAPETPIVVCQVAPDRVHRHSSSPVLDGSGRQGTKRGRIRGNTLRLPSEIFLPYVISKFTAHAWSNPPRISSLMAVPLYFRPKPCAYVMKYLCFLWVALLSDSHSLLWWL